MDEACLGYRFKYYRLVHIIKYHLIEKQVRDPTSVSSIKRSPAVPKAQPKSSTLTARFRAALRFARTYLGDIAEDAGYARGTLERYLNRVPPGPAVARAVADALEARGRRLLDHAERVRDAADDLESQEG